MIRNLHKKGLFAILIALILSFSGALASAAAMNYSDYYAAIAGGNLITGNRVVVQGSVASNESSKIGKYSVIQGDVFSGENLLVKRNATLNGIAYTQGNLKYQRNVQSGSVNSFGYAKIGKFDNIRGYVSAAGPSKINATATILDKSQPEILPSRSFVKHDMPTFAPKRGQKETLRLSGNQILEPGSYDNILTKTNSVINLSAGTYNLSNFKLSKFTTIIADSSMGDINIVINGKFKSYNYVTLDNIGQGAVDIYADGDIALGKKNNFQANLLSGSNLIVDRHSTIEGFTYSDKNTLLHTDVFLNFNPHAFGSELPPTVPEPASIMLLGSAAMFIVRKRKA